MADYTNILSGGNIAPSDDFFSNVKTKIKIKRKEFDDYQNQMDALDGNQGEYLRIIAKKEINTPEQNDDWKERSSTIREFEKGTHEDQMKMYTDEEWEQLGKDPFIRTLRRDPRFDEWFNTFRKDRDD